MTSEQAGTVTGEAFHDTHGPKNLTLEYACVFGLFCVLGVVYTWPLCFHLGTYITGRGDPLQHLAVSYWVGQAILSGKLGGIWNVPPMYWPAHNTLAFGDPQFGTTVLGLPLYLATRNIVTAYNFVVVAAMPLCAFGCYLLARHITGRPVASVVAGVAWGYCRWRSGEAPHQQILCDWGFPVVLLLLHLYGETGRRGYLAGLCLAWFVQEFLAEYWGAFLLMLIAPMGLFMLRWRYGRSWASVGAVSVVVGVALVPWLVVQAHFLRNGVRHPLAEIVSYSGDLADYLPARNSLIYGSLGRVHELGGGAVLGEAQVSPGLLCIGLAGWAVITAFRVRHVRAGVPRETVRSGKIKRAGAIAFLAGAVIYATLVALGTDNLEVFGVPGWLMNSVVALLIAVAGVAALGEYTLRKLFHTVNVTLRPERRSVVIYLLLALIAMVWSCGYTVEFAGHPIMPGIYQLFGTVPGARSFRVLVRMGNIAELGIVVLAATGIQELFDRRRVFASPRARALAGAAMAAFVWAEAWPRGGTLFNRAKPQLPDIRPADLWLAHAPRGVVLELPLTISAFVEGERLWRQTVHRQPMVNGAETFFRPGYYSDVRVFSHPASPAAIQRAKELGLSYVVIDTANKFAGESTPLGAVPRVSASLPAPYRLVFSSPGASVYTLP